MLKFISLGCKVNSYEGNALKELFFLNGFKEDGEYDIVVINTCSVTAVADQKSRQIIRRERRNNPNAILCVMGCYSQKNAEYVKKECGADIIVGTSNRDKIIDFVKQFIKDKKQIAESVGVGAVIFSALWNNRIKDIVFSFDKVLNFDGETAPYVQYTYARCLSALRKGGKIDFDKVDYSAIASDEAYEVVKSVLAFGDSVAQAGKLREPCMVSRHIVDLAEKFNRFYIDHRIVVDDDGTRNARLLLTQAVANTLKTGLSLLGIDAPQEM